MMENEVVTAKSRQTVDLPAPPSCIEFLVLSYFVIGTYSLAANEGDDGREQATNTEKVSRRGSVCLITEDEGEYCLVQTSPTASAVLDIKVNDTNKSFVVANSTGGIEIWRFSLELDQDASQDHKLGLIKHVQAFPRDILVLYIDRHPKEEQIFAVALSDGSIAVVDCQRVCNHVFWRQQVHSLEPWTVTWVIGSTSDGKADSKTLLSGGDDSTIYLTKIEEDILKHDAVFQMDCLSMSEKKAHNAGVTAFLSLKPDPYVFRGRVGDILVTGSYDEHIRILKVRFGRWEVLAERCLDGGVWRMGLIDVRQDGDRYDTTKWYVLASCMHAGTRVVEISRKSSGEWDIRILLKFTEHESMNYASTYVTRSHETQDSSSSSLEDVTCLTTSFYDKRLCVWNMPLRAELQQN